MAGSIASEASSYSGKGNYKIISLSSILHVPILPMLDQGFSDRFLATESAIVAGSDEVSTRWSLIKFSLGYPQLVEQL
jgi:hypothetical protein